MQNPREEIVGEYNTTPKGLENLFEELDSKLNYLMNELSIKDGWDFIDG